MKNIWKKHWSVILLALIIVAQLIYSSYVFAVKKQGYHSDEIFSYGLANSYDKPFIYMKDGLYMDDGFTEDDTVNYRQWLDGDVLRDYITVQEGERFAYGSVYHNQSLDNHPPFYYNILHTLCSFFPNVYSRYFAFALNLIFMAVAQIFLFKLVKLLCKSQGAALCCCLLYGAGTGALSTIIFLRQYCFITMLLLMFVYYSSLTYERIMAGADKKSFIKALVGTGVSALCLFLTNYSVIAFCGVFTALMCIWLLCKKKIKRMLVYGSTVLAALGIFLAVFPFMLKHVTGYSTIKKEVFSFITSFFRVCHYVFSQSVGIGFSIYKSSAGAVIFMILVIAAAVCVPLGFLFRKEKWFKKLMDSVKNTIKSIPGWLRRANYVPLFILVGVVAHIAVTAKIVDVIHMGIYSRRYVFFIYPLCCVAVVAAVAFVAKHIPKIKKQYVAVVLTACVLMAANENISYPTKFLFTHSDGYTDVAELTKDKNVLVVFPGGSRGDSEAWLMTCYCPYLYDCDHVFFTSEKDYISDMEKIAGQNDINYVIAPITSFKLADMTDEEYNKLIAPYSTKGDTSSDEVPMVDVRASDNDEQFENDIRKLNGGCDFEALFTMNVQGATDLVCRLK